MPLLVSQQSRARDITGIWSAVFAFNFSDGRISLLEARIAATQYSQWQCVVL